MVDCVATVGGNDTCRLLTVVSGCGLGANITLILHGYNLSLQELGGYLS